MLNDADKKYRKYGFRYQYTDRTMLLLFDILRIDDKIKDDLTRNFQMILPICTSDLKLENTFQGM